MTKRKSGHLFRWLDLILETWILSLLNTNFLCSVKNLYSWQKLNVLSKLILSKLIHRAQCRNIHLLFLVSFLLSIYGNK